MKTKLILILKCKLDFGIKHWNNIDWINQNTTFILWGSDWNVDLSSNSKIVNFDAWNEKLNHHIVHICYMIKAQR